MIVNILAIIFLLKLSSKTHFNAPSFFEDFLVLICPRIKPHSSGFITHPFNSCIKGELCFSLLDFSIEGNI